MTSGKFTGKKSNRRKILVSAPSDTVFSGRRGSRGAFFLAYLLRLDFSSGRLLSRSASTSFRLSFLVQFSSLFLVGAYSIIWRYVSFEDIKAFLKAALISGVILLLVRSTVFARQIYPVAGSAFDYFDGHGFGVCRTARRSEFCAALLTKSAKNARFKSGKRRIKRKSTLFVGAGRIGALAVKDVLGRGDTEFEIKGFVDDDRHKKGGSVNGIKVFGTTDDLARLVDELNIEQVVIAIDQAQGKDIRRILNICSEIPVRARIVPSLHEIIHGRVQVSRIRDVQIEDLLGREPVQLDDKNLHEFLTGKTVMVTGAGGSIGSELVRQIAEFQPETASSGRANRICSVSNRARTDLKIFPN